MISQFLFFLLVTVIVGGVNLLLAQPMEKPVSKEITSYLSVVVGGIVAFTGVILLLSALFQPSG